jgi:hypothetical protein
VPRPKSPGTTLPASWPFAEIRTEDFACLLGLGASAINPYLALDTIEDMRRRQMLSERLTTEDARKHYLKALGKGPPPSSARR